MLDKSRSLNVDCIAYDLEDSVTPSKKAEARSNIKALLNQPRAAGIREQAVRINGVDSGAALDDLTEIVRNAPLVEISVVVHISLMGRNQKLKAPNLDTIVIPKVNSASDLHFVTDVIRHALPHRHSSTLTPTLTQQAPIKILALIESAKALSSLSSICTSTPYLSGLIFAAEDFALDLSMTRTPSLSEFLYARSAIATACRAHNLPSTIDLVCTAYKGEDGLQTLEEECVGGKGLGFNGKQLIHPSQVEVAQRAFSPSEEEVAWAMRVVIGDEKADQEGRGAWTLDDKMIDAPVAGKARAIVKKAEACGFDIEKIRERWKDQLPR
ncbi:MAG: hypothetical protein M1836_003994 [Candelina mexicana]|nr:MAG: hypothetical protein M1836_003994 [Candelina mexicana]